MRKLIFMFSMLILCINLVAEEDEFKSKEETEYYKNEKTVYSPFKPIDSVFILKASYSK